MWKIKKNDDGSYEFFDGDGRQAGYEGCVGKFADADTVAFYLACALEKISVANDLVYTLTTKPGASFTREEWGMIDAYKKPGVVQWIKQDGTPLEREA